MFDIVQLGGFWSPQRLRFIVSSNFAELDGLRGSGALRIPVHLSTSSIINSGFGAGVRAVKSDAIAAKEHII